MNRQTKASDWTTFRERVPSWRERYLAARNEEVARILTGDGDTPTERFWEAKGKMEEEARVLRTCLDGHSRSDMPWSLFLMHRHGLIGDDDLEPFSPELRAWVLAALRDVGA